MDCCDCPVLERSPAEVQYQFVVTCHHHLHLDLLSPAPCFSMSAARANP